MGLKGKNVMRVNEKKQWRETNSTAEVRLSGWTNQPHDVKEVSDH